MSNIDILEKVYLELQETKSEVKDNSSHLADVESWPGKSESTLEHDISDNIKILNEVVSGRAAKLEDHSGQLGTIDEKLDYLAVSINAQDRRLTTVEGSRKVK